MLTGLFKWSNTESQRLCSQRADLHPGGRVFVGSPQRGNRASRWTGDREIEREVRCETYTLPAQLAEERTTEPTITKKALLLLIRLHVWKKGLQRQSCRDTGCGERQSMRSKTNIQIKGRITAQATVFNFNKSGYN